MALQNTFDCRHTGAEYERQRARGNSVGIIQASKMAHVEMGRLQQRGGFGVTGSRPIPDCSLSLTIGAGMTTDSNNSRPTVRAALGHGRPSSESASNTGFFPAGRATFNP
jgi:hypothetical protein